MLNHCQTECVYEPVACANQCGYRGQRSSLQSHLQECPVELGRIREAEERQRAEALAREEKAREEALTREQERAALAVEAERKRKADLEVQSESQIDSSIQLILQNQQQFRVNVGGHILLPLLAH